MLRAIRLVIITALTVPTLVAATTAGPVAAAEPASIRCAENPPAASSGESSRLSSFDALTPRRLVDTRSAVGGAQGPVGENCTLVLDVGEADLPEDAAAFSLSVTAIGSQPGFVSVFPCEAGLPDSSNLNTRPGSFPTPNLVVARPDASGRICLYTRFEAELLVDVTGYWTAEGEHRFASIDPMRAYDSRERDGGTPVAAGSVREIDVSGQVPDGTEAIVANLTVTEPAAAGFLTAFPCGGQPPTASNLNFAPGESVAVASIVGVSDQRRVCVTSNTDVHVLVDLAGYYAPAPQWGPAAEFVPIDGRRLADSRSSTGTWTSKFPGDSARQIRPVDGLAIGPQTTAVVLNVVATDADAPGFVSIYPCEEDRPTVSSVNYYPGRESTNLVVVDLPRSGRLCTYTLTPVHLVVDLFGVMAGEDGALVERMGFDVYTWPPHSTTGTDYAVECGTAGVRTLQLDPLPGTTARVNGVPVTEGPIRLYLAPDRSTEVQLSRGGSASKLYSLRCLPPEFPRLEVDRTGEPSPGWYLTVLTARPSGHTFTVILDNHGAPVWYKHIETGVIDIHRRRDGRLVYIEPGPRFGIDVDNGYRVTSLSGTLLDVETAVPDPNDPDTDYPADHHDYVELPGGGRALLTYPLLRDQDLSPIGPGYTDGETILDNVVQEISKDDELLWSWRTSDHFGYDEVTFPQRWGVFPQEPNGGEVDVFHLNSLFRIDDGSGDYMMSARHLDAVFRVDRATGTVDWILGSLPVDAPNKGGATRLVTVDDPLGGPLRPHDARLVGNVLTLFDNRTATDPEQPARAVAYEIDDVAGTATLLWQIDEPQGRSSDGQGSNRVFHDGSVLVDWGALLQPMFEEFDAAHESVMRITQVDNGVAYRITKLPASTYRLSTLRELAGGWAERP